MRQPSPLDPDGDGSDAVLAHVISDVLDLLESNHRVVLTHGNGPQVGHLLRLNRGGAAGLNSDLGLDIWVAATQGTIGANSRPSRCGPRFAGDRAHRRDADPDEVDPDDPGSTLQTGRSCVDTEEVFEYDRDVASAIRSRRAVASPAPCASSTSRCSNNSSSSTWSSAVVVVGSQSSTRVPRRCPCGDRQGPCKRPHRHLA